MTVLEKFGTRLHWNISRSSPASCWNHHKAVTHIDIVWVYTFGSHYFIPKNLQLVLLHHHHQYHQHWKILHNQNKFPGYMWQTPNLIQTLHRNQTHRFGYFHHPHHPLPLLHVHHLNHSHPNQCQTQILIRHHSHIHHPLLLRCLFHQR
ncbi:hypothetical protein HU200_031922 [Digitaria exilis]|uniref:Uncharacterized protein n=1 Tax=Digitaria exilis TaxID=1010633 RepID=A0A835EPI2_9POAL|nr:hypothetical protein HU200_031922 [Digitaria exilis]